MAFAVQARDEHHCRWADARHERGIVTGAARDVGRTKAEFIRAAGEKTFYAPVGCKACGGGYRGRTAIHEILVMDEALRRVVTEGADRAALRDAVRRAGIKSMLIDGLEKAAAGITSVQEVIRVVPHGMNF